MRSSLPVCIICQDIERLWGGDELHAISTCGHVYHGKCLRKYWPYCKGGLVCPYCKTKCSAGDVHRLYFVGQDDNPEGESLENCSPDELAAQIEELEARLADADASLQAAQLAESKAQRTVLDLQGAVAAQSLGRSTAQASLSSAKTELQLERRCNSELKQKLKKAESELLAAQQLVQRHQLSSDLNITEEEIARLRGKPGADRDALISSLASSLVKRNGDYKKLYNDCNKLGSESRLAKQRAADAEAQVRRLEGLLRDSDVIIEREQSRKLKRALGADELDASKVKLQPRALKEPVRLAALAIQERKRARLAPPAASHAGTVEERLPTTSSGVETPAVATELEMPEQSGAGEQRVQSAEDVDVEEETQELLEITTATRLSEADSHSAAPPGSSFSALVQQHQQKRNAFAKSRHAGATAASKGLGGLFAQPPLARAQVRPLGAGTQMTAPTPGLHAAPQPNKQWRDGGHQSIHTMTGMATETSRGIRPPLQAPSNVRKAELKHVPATKKDTRQGALLRIEHFFGRE